MEKELTALINEVGRLESLSMSIYVRFARVFGDDGELKAFWMSMARHEAGHVGALRLLTLMLEQAGTAIDIPASSQAATAAAKLIDALGAEAEAGVSLDRAFGIALELESAEFEDLVLDLVHALSDATQRDQAEQMLIHDLSDLSLMIEKHSDDEVLLEKADALIESRVDRRESRMVCDGKT